MNKAETITIMAILREAYPNFYKDKSAEDATTAVNLWADMFGPYPYRIVEAAVKAHIASDTKGFPPVIGQIMEMVRKLTRPDEMSEMEAWALVRKALNRSGYNAQEEFDKLPRSVQRAVGNASQLKTWAIDDNFNESVVSSNFMRAYRSTAKQQREFDAMPPDVQELALKIGNGLSMERLEESKK